MVQSDRLANIRQEKYHKYTDPEIWDNILARGQHILILILSLVASPFRVGAAAHVKCKQAIKWRCWLHLPRSKKAPLEYITQPTHRPAHSPSVFI